MYVRKKIYKLFAEELIKEVYKEIHINLPYYFDNGLSGIAWGIEYLIRNSFVKGEADLVLEELDSKILEWDVRRIRDISLEKGLKGLAYYIIARCSDKKNRKIPDYYIRDIISSYQLNDPIGSEKANSNKVFERLMAILDHNVVDFDADFFDELIFRTKIPKRNIFINKRPLGLLNDGYAAIGLKTICHDEKKNIYF